jgi:hypothetical protein
LRVLKFTLCFFEWTCIPKKTDWRQNTSLIKDLIHNLESFNRNNSEDLDRLADKFKKTILNAYEASCPIVHRKVKKDVPWWEKKHEDLLKEVRKLENNKRNDREAFKTALTTYNKIIYHSEGNPLSSSVRR